jgi:Helix-turn-helix domain
VNDTRLELMFPAELVERIASRAAEIALERLRAESESPSRWLTVEEAARYGRWDKQHIYDMRSDGRLSRDGEHGHALVDRHELDAYIDNSRRS